MQQSKGALERWLDQVHEDPTPSPFPLVDAHHHLWDKAKYEVGSALEADVAKMFGTRSARGDPYAVEDFLQDLRGNNVAKSVYVENTGAFYDEGAAAHLRHVGEVRQCQRISDDTADGDVHLCAGIVGKGDLLLEEAVLRSALQALLEAAPRSLRGIRHQTTYHDHPEVFSRGCKGILSHPRFRANFGVLSQYRLSADVVVYHTQLEEVERLAREYPDVPIVLDHMGTPLGVGPYEGRRSEVLEDWKARLHGVARCPNVALKLSGLAMPICGFGWERRAMPPTSSELAAAMGPYVQHGIAEFGVGRCMFASNFPVDKASCGYTELWNAFKAMVADRPLADQRALFCDTATRVYRLL